MANRVILRLLVTLDVIVIAFGLLFATLPTFDYALREYKTYISSPSEKTFAAFRRKQREEVYVRAAVAGSSAVVAGLIAVPLFRIRRRLKKA